MKSKIFNLIEINYLLIESFFFSRREKEENLENNNDDDEDTLKNGFVPIGQAVKNAEVRSAAATTTTTMNGEI